jgi:hypothetical protein
MVIPVYRPLTWRRIGELCEELANGGWTPEHCRRVAELRTDADAELQPAVAESRRRLDRLGNQ